MPLVIQSEPTRGEMLTKGSILDQDTCYDADGRRWQVFCFVNEQNNAIARVRLDDRRDANGNRRSLGSWEIHHQFDSNHDGRDDADMKIDRVSIDIDNWEAAQGHDSVMVNLVAHDGRSISPREWDLGEIAIPGWHVYR